MNSQPIVIFIQQPALSIPKMIHRLMYFLVSYWKKGMEKFHLFKHQNESLCDNFRNLVSPGEVLIHRVFLNIEINYKANELFSVQKTRLTHIV